MADHQAEKPLRLNKKMLAEVMKEIDFCMMTTVGNYGRLTSRPMSNNRNVTWEGDTWFFANADTAKVKEIERDPNVDLVYAVPDDIVFISVTGRGTIVRDDAKKKELWYKDLERWFPNGPEDDNVVLIKVVGKSARFWSKEGDGELAL